MTDDYSRREYTKLVSAISGASFVGLAGCSGDGDNDRATEDDDDSDPATDDGDQSMDGDQAEKDFEVWAWSTPAREEERQWLGEQFGEQANAEVTWQQFPFGDYLTKAQTSISSGSPPDSMDLSVLWLPKFSSNGQLTNLSENGFDAGDYQPGPIGSAMWEDNLYAIPYSTALELPVINTKMFEEAGIEIPERTEQISWDRFSEWLEVLTEEHGTGVGADPGILLEKLFIANNGYWITEEKPYEPAIDDEPVLEAARFLDEHRDYVTTYGTSSDGYSEFYAGRIPILVGGGTWLLPSLKDSDVAGDWMFIRNPHGPRSDVGRSPAGGNLYTVPKDAGNKELGLQWLKFLSSMEVQERVFANTGALPGLAAAMESDGFQEALDDTPALETAVSAAEDTVPFPPHPNADEMRSISGDAGDRIMENGDPEQALETAASEIQRIL